MGALGRELEALRWILGALGEGLGILEWDMGALEERGTLAGELGALGVGVEGYSELARLLGL